MKIRFQTFWLPKRGNSEEEYEDAAFPMESGESESDEFLCAVADGATEASFSRRWAQLLVQGFADRTELAELAQKWSDEILTMELPWYAQEKAESGAFATLSGLILNGTTGTYSSKLLGDSCIFHIRDDKLVESFPMTNYESFNSSPALLCSRLSQHEDLESIFSYKEGEWISGDRFILLTDAIAAWIFKLQESKGDGIKTLIAIKDQVQLAELCADARATHDEEGRPNMRNDDVTLLDVHVYA
ncbi:MAG: protein phosphatase 2C domain-containing protein [Candidatus Melainabacteria bacterium]|nr:protein phosphatase 2C domain-containing protein [Candidatus Melainabacteria bacterium]